MSKTTIRQAIRSIEWADQFNTIGMNGHTYLRQDELIKYLESLIEIEKSQIKDAFECGQNEEGVYAACPGHKRQNGNDFYNETYPQL